MWQTASDFIVFLGWFFQNAGQLVIQIFSPIRYIFSFAQNFFINAFSPPPVNEEIWGFPAEILSVFDSIPYWDTLIFILGIGLMLIFGFAILKIFLKT